jgi:hypothetical protein
VYVRLIKHVLYKHHITSHHLFEDRQRRNNLAHTSGVRALNACLALVTKRLSQGYLNSGTPPPPCRLFSRIIVIVMVIVIAMHSVGGGGGGVVREVATRSHPQRHVVGLVGEGGGHVEQLLGEGGAGLGGGADPVHQREVIT